MDLQYAADMKISKEKEKSLQKKMGKIIDKSEKSYDRWVCRMRKAGYSDEEIENMLCF